MRLTAPTLSALAGFVACGLLTGCAEIASTEPASVFDVPAGSGGMNIIGGLTDTLLFIAIVWLSFGLIVASVVAYSLPGSDLPPLVTVTGIWVLLGMLLMETL